MNIDEQFLKEIINLKDDSGNTALMFAASGGHLEIARVLVETGADINLRDEYGETALMLASAKGHLEIASLLIENNADINLRDEYGKTALMRSAFYGHITIANLLLDKGAEVNLEDKNGYKALDYAENKVNMTGYVPLDNGEMINLIKQYGGKHKDPLWDWDYDFCNR